MQGARLPAADPLRPRRPRRPDARSAAGGRSGPPALRGAPRRQARLARPERSRRASPAFHPASIPAPRHPAAPRSSPSPIEPPMQGQLLNEITNEYANLSVDWLDALLPMAQRVFVLLATIELAWSGIWWALHRPQGREPDRQPGPQGLRDHVLLHGPAVRRRAGSRSSSAASSRPARRPRAGAASTPRTCSRSGSTRRSCSGRTITSVYSWCEHAARPRHRAAVRHPRLRDHRRLPGGHPGRVVHRHRRRRPDARLRRLAAGPRPWPRATSSTPSRWACGSSSSTC